MQIIHYIQQPSRHEHRKIAVVVQGQVSEGDHPEGCEAHAISLSGVDISSSLDEIAKLAKLATYGADSIYPGAIIQLIGEITLMQFHAIVARSDSTIQHTLPTQFPHLFST